MNLRNKHRFWVGAVMGIFELLGLGIFYLTRLSWAWLTERRAFFILIVSLVVLYNVLAVILIVNGSGNK